jgi:ribosomal protein L23
MESSKVLKYPVSTEKAIKLMETENTLVFIVDAGASNDEVKKAVETSFKVKVTGVNLLKDMKGRRKAYVKIGKETPAIDIATQLGMM